MKEPQKIEASGKKPVESEKVAGAEPVEEKDETIARLQQENRRLIQMNESASTQVKALQRVTERYAAASLMLTETMGDLRNENRRLADENVLLRRRLSERESRLSELMQELERKPKK